MSIDKLFSTLKARGNFGHSGRPGKQGGSAPSGKLSTSTGNHEVNAINHAINKIISSDNSDQDHIEYLKLLARRISTNKVLGDDEYVELEKMKRDYMKDSSKRGFYD